MAGIQGAWTQGILNYVLRPTTLVELEYLEEARRRKRRKRRRRGGGGGGGGGGDTRVKGSEFV